MNGCERCENEARSIGSSVVCICGPNVRCSKSIEDCISGQEEKGGNWPPYIEGQTYVRDREGVIWLLLPEYDGGMASTATAAGPWTVGINPLRNERGPLYILSKDNAEVWKNCPAMLPDCEEHEPAVEYTGPYGSGLNRHMRKVTYCRKCTRTIGLG